jgi:hypothetical protein
MEEQMGEGRASDGDCKIIPMSEVGLHPLARRVDLFKQHFLLRPMSRFPRANVSLEGGHLAGARATRMLRTQQSEHRCPLQGRIPL